ncbi:MAG TPA: SRPBCC family protein [Ferruginibacter sp.]|nr:SRPBCC family protein [Ferruginibacter sp.]HMP19834.1 SRPBCC family protein [Ferruginibacter sp.]
MSTIHLTTFIAAPAERVFDLSRSVNLHRISTMHTGEKAIDGTMNGLMNENDWVTWQAKHLYRQRKFTSKITGMQRPEYFIDEMIKGDFKNFRHEHHFKATDNGTIMIDLLQFECPYGIIGTLLEKFYLKNYLENLLQQRNKVVKEYAESSKWIAMLS